VASTWAIVVAAGAGTRYAAGAPDAPDAPVKQFSVLGGSRVVDRSVHAAITSCDAVALALPPGVTWDGPPVDAVVEGGATRADSVRAGLRVVPDDVDVIVVHDAARPLASSALFGAVIAAVAAGADGAVPAVRVPDTIKRVDGDQVVATLARDDLVAVQTPQGFRAAALRAAHAVAADATDDAALVEAGGGRVVTVPGEPTNLKVTTRADLRVAEALVAQER
jgi:2-C-methyl-D-erythritol 4-phosphate cytidylyltransferase